MAGDDQRKRSPGIDIGGNCAHSIGNDQGGIGRPTRWHSHQRRCGKAKSLFSVSAHTIQLVRVGGPMQTMPSHRLLQMSFKGTLDLALLHVLIRRDRVCHVTLMNFLFNYPQMRIPAEHFRNVPVALLSPSLMNSPVSSSTPSPTQTQGPSGPSSMLDDGFPRSLMEKLLRTESAAKVGLSKQSAVRHQFNVQFSGQWSDITNTTKWHRHGHGPFNK